MADPSPTPTQTTPSEAGSLPPGARLRIAFRALLTAARERRTKRALFFTLASLMVGATVAGRLGLFVCGAFGGSLYLVVLVQRMQRHLQFLTHSYHERRAAGATDQESPA